MHNYVFCRCWKSNSNSVLKFLIHKFEKLGGNMHTFRCFTYFKCIDTHTQPLQHFYFCISIDLSVVDRTSLEIPWTKGMNWKFQEPHMRKNGKICRINEENHFSPNEKSKSHLIVLERVPLVTRRVAEGIYFTLVCLAYPVFFQSNPTIQKICKCAEIKTIPNLFIFNDAAHGFLRSSFVVSKTGIFVYLSTNDTNWSFLKQSTTLRLRMLSANMSLPSLDA